MAYKIKAIAALKRHNFRFYRGSPVKDLKMMRKFYIKYGCCPFAICFKKYKGPGKGGRTDDHSAVTIVSG
jgi:hypothetical protein